MPPTKTGSILLISCALVALGACSKPNFRPETATAVAPQASLSEPTWADMNPVNDLPQRLGIADRLAFKVYGVPELDRDVRVDSSGAIDLPLVGSLNVAGMETAAVRTIIEDRLRARYLQDPQVTLEVIEAVSQRFVIEGGVKSPGIYQVTGNQTLLQAVAQAQGTTEFARASEVVVFRTINGQPSAALFDLDAVRGGRLLDPRIYPNDRIVIGTDTSRALIKDLISLTPIVGVFYQVFQ
ncbi:MAG: hypothetical protein RLZZ58_2130 [Pseudomonadota bacterium]|jgi:polysaccharide export outer membrane protein